MKMKKASLVGMALIGMTMALQVGAEEVILAEGFEAADNFKTENGYKCTDIKIRADKDEFQEGNGALRIAWTSSDASGAFSLSREIKPLDITGKIFSFMVMSPDGKVMNVGIEFYDSTGKRADEYRQFNISGAGQWTNIKFTQGKTERGQWRREIKEQSGDPTKITRIVFRAQTKGANQTAELILDDFKITSEEVKK